LEEEEEEARASLLFTAQLVPLGGEPIRLGAPFVVPELE